MATRVLPGVYVSLNDLSQLPEGSTSLTVGYPLAAKRGPVNEFGIVTSPTDFLTRYTLSGSPEIADDPTFHSIIKVLGRTNQMYVVRAANNPLYGGAVITKSADYGNIAAASKADRTITLAGDEAPVVGEQIVLTGTGTIDGYYTVVAVEDAPNSGAGYAEEGKVVKVKEVIAEDYPKAGVSTTGTKMAKCSVQPLADQKIAEVETAEVTDKMFTFDGSFKALFPVGGKFAIKGAATAENNKEFTVDTVAVVEGKTEVKVLEEIAATEEGADLGIAYAHGIANPETYAFGENDLIFIAGKDPGAYNGRLAFIITSYADQPNQMVYPNTMTLSVVDYDSKAILESFTFSLDPSAKTIDGISLYYEKVVAGSAYIQMFNKPDNLVLPNSTLAIPAKGGNGSDGGTVTADTLVAALEVFADKTIPISILGSNCSPIAEDGAQILQAAMIDLANRRGDIMCFLNSRKSDENATLPSARVQNIIDYKKGDLGSTSFYGCMYTPHCEIPDIFNQRQVEIGPDAIAIAGWLGVINNLDYPYAYAGPQNGLVSGATCKWKIGDMSGEAELLNDASINYVAYDGKVGRYYMQTQNTLQIANSAMRDIGVVLNVLDIKETLARLLKEYINLPITDVLRADILNTCNDYLAPMQGTRFYNYDFSDISSEADIADDTLRYLLVLSPTRYASKIYLVMNIVNANFDFSILQSA